MSESIRAVRGMHDVLGDETPRWQHLEQTIARVLTGYGYQEIRLPIVENTELFERSIGVQTDIVCKEMYTFADRNGDSLTLRPEGTAGCVRAVLEHGLLGKGSQRLWYVGPMFRHERPQKGRFRQFHQVGAEVFGIASPDIDAELICMTARIWGALGISDLRLEINSLGSMAARAAYRETLRSYFLGHENLLDEDSKRRLAANPLRILDSKNPELTELIASAPGLDTCLDKGSAEHFEKLQDLLSNAGVDWCINARLVRGLDYYNRTVFEWISGDLGAQDTVCAGGRYDGLVEQFGGNSVPAVGFALGVERLLDLVPTSATKDAVLQPQVYFIVAGERAVPVALRISEELRSTVPDLKMVFHCGGGSFRSQFKKADRCGAEFALLLGEDELDKGLVAIKPLRAEGHQEQIPMHQLATTFAKLLQRKA